MEWDGKSELSADAAAEVLKDISPYPTWFTEQMVWAAVEYRIGRYGTLSEALTAAAARAVYDRRQG